MTVFRLVASELKRMTTGLLPKLSILALALVPLLYGAVYLYANWDPYSNLDKLTAAIVVTDQGTTDADGNTRNVGETVAETLISDKKFDWVPVQNEQDAYDGVSSGEYSFALTFPQDFSANLASPSNFDSAKQALLKVTTNDANNYLLSSIVDKVGEEIRNSVTKEVGEETSKQLLTGFGTIHTQMLQAADGAEQLANGARDLHDGTGQLRTGSQDLHDGTGRLRTGINSLNTGVNELAGGSNELATGSKTLASGARQVADGNAALNTEVQSAVSTLSQLETATQEAINSRLREAEAQGVITPEQRGQLEERFENSSVRQQIVDARTTVDSGAQNIQKLADGSAQVADGADRLAAGAEKLNDGVGKLSDGVSQLADGAAQVDDGAGKLADGAAQVDDGAGKLADGAAQVDDGAGKLADGSAELAQKLAEGAGKVPNPQGETKSRAAKVMSDPIALNTNAQTKAGSYGAGIAPFFLVLALWIGAFMLVQAMRPLALRALASNAPSWKIALGGWLPFFLISTVQALLLYVVSLFGLGLTPAHPGLTLVLLLLASMAFTALIQGIVALLGTPGKFVVLILLVLQLVSSGGTFPWQTTPEPLHTLHQILPMGHVVDGMRILLYGAPLDPLPGIIWSLIGYTALGLFMSLLAVHRHKYWTLKTLQPEISI